MAGKRRYDPQQNPIMANQERAAEAKVKSVTRVPDKIDRSMMPGEALQVIDMKDEVERRQVLKVEVEDIKALTAELVALRERANLQGRFKNLVLIEKLDVFLENMLDMLTAEEMTERMETAMNVALAKGDIKQVKELMVAIGIAIDKKNAMLSDSGFTDGRKKGVKIAVNFANDGSTQVGVQMD